MNNEITLSNQMELPFRIVSIHQAHQLRLLAVILGSCWLEMPVMHFHPIVDKESMQVFKMLWHWTGRFVVKISPPAALLWGDKAKHFMLSDALDVGGNESRAGEWRNSPGSIWSWSDTDHWGASKIKRQITNFRLTISRNIQFILVCRQ